MLSVSFSFGHKTFTILYPDVITTSWLELMHSNKISIRDQCPPVQPVPRVVLPALLKIYAGLRACRAKQGHFRSCWVTSKMPKPKPFPLLEVTPLTPHTQQFPVAILYLFKAITGGGGGIGIGSPERAGEMPCSSFSVVFGNNVGLMFDIRGCPKDSHPGVQM